MKVEGPNPLRAGAVRRKSGTDAASGESFALALESEIAGEAAPSGVSGTGATAGVSTILALQAAEGEEGDAAKRRAKSRADEILKKLDMLRLDILAGAIPRDHLIGLAQSVKSMRERVFDPALTEVLDEIDLRAQVELAKYDPFR